MAKYRCHLPPGYTEIDINSIHVDYDPEIEWRPLIVEIPKDKNSYSTKFFAQKEIIRQELLTGKLISCKYLTTILDVGNAQVSNLFYEVRTAMERDGYNVVRHKKQFMIEKG